MSKKPIRTAASLRDVLWNEIEELQTSSANPRKASAVAGLARQIMETAKVEMEHARLVHLLESGGASSHTTALGTMKLGSS